MWLKQYAEYLSHLNKQQRYSRLAVEITIVLTVKVILIWLLWWSFFSQPIPKEARQDAVTRVILTPSVTRPSEAQNNHNP